MVVLVANNRGAVNTTNVTLHGEFPYRLADGNTATSKVYIVDEDGSFNVNGPLWSYPASIGVIHFN